ncbi:MAG: HupE/UreJ family protein [Woeseia sp.]
MKALSLIAACFLPLLVMAHESSTVELTLNTATQHFRVEMDLSDTEFSVAIPRADQTALTVADVQNASPVIAAYIQRNLDIRDCSLVPDGEKPGLRPGNRPRVSLGFALQCRTTPTTVELTTAIFSELPDYRTVLNVVSRDGSRLYIVDNETIQVRVDTKSFWTGFSTFVIEGATHILGGFDHLLFLLLLALPMLKHSTWRSRLTAVASIVTAFTIAHSITLALSGLGYMSLPARPVEVVIAASIVVVALLNVFGRSDSLAWPLAYAFGLVHGFGFAGAFAELASGATVRWSDLLAFNIGVEAGQLAVIVSVLLLLCLLARSRTVGRALTPIGSVAAGLVGFSWIIERL